MTLYIVGTTTNTFSLIEFDHGSSTDHLDFQEGRTLQNDAVALRYRIERKAAFNKLKKMHFVESTGPHLVSSRFREALWEEEDRGEVEFFDVDIESEHGDLDDFFAMNVTHRIACTDMERSEAELTNFDPADPHYDFDYHVLLPDFGSDLHLATCHEMPLLTIVGEVVLSRLSDAKLTGLVLSSALDLTTLGRSESVTI